MHADKLKKLQRLTNELFPRVITNFAPQVVVLTNLNVPHDELGLLQMGKNFSTTDYETQVLVSDDFGGLSYWCPQRPTFELR